MDKTRLDLVCFQETMVHSENARRFMSFIQPYWFCCAVNFVRTSDGLLVAWDPIGFDLNAFLNCGGILLKGHIIARKRVLSILNVYGPCTKQRLFWTKISDLGIL